MFLRHIASAVRTALADTPVVMLHGPRQVGKSTLARHIAESERPARRYLTLDDAAVLAAAEADPAGLLAGLDGPVVLDEVQRAPGLLLAIKAAVDRQRRPGRFLLTGSADPLMIPHMADALAGRVEIVTLWPLAQSELEGRPGTVIDAMFSRALPPLPKPLLAGPDLLDRVVQGGFPEVARRRDLARRTAWFGAYLTTVVQRDVRELANIDGLIALPRLLALLASRPMTTLNAADLARHVGLPQTTLKRYLALLETAMLVQTLPAWFVNVGKRLVKSPKVWLVDTGLAAHLQGLDVARLRHNRTPLGPLLENFVVAELKKQIGWSAVQPRAFHFRTAEGSEVDVVLERASGEIVGVEIKATASVGANDFKGLRLLAESAKRRFHRGVVLYTGADVVPFGANLHAVPIEALWHW